MATAPILRVFAEILDDCDRREAEHHLDVVPVLVDNINSDLPLIREICRHRYGQAPHLAENAVEGCSGEPSPSAKAFVECITTGGPEVLRVTRTGAGLWAARFEGEPDPTNPGSVNFLGLLTALLDPDLARHHRVAVVAYEETQMDAILRDVAWRALLDDLPTADVLTVSTLIVLVGNPDVDVDRHCRRGRSVRFAVRAGGVSERRRWENVESEVTHLASGDGPIVLFLGAGSSRSSDLPLGDEMRDDALRRYTAMDATVPIDDVILQFHKMLSADHRLLEAEKNMDTTTFAATLTLERVLREEAHRGGIEMVPETLRTFARRNDAALTSPGAAVRVLRALTGLQSRLVIATVNFDTLIEHLPATPVARFVTETEFENVPTYLTEYLKNGGDVPLLKLHGSIDDPETIVANVDLTAEGLPEPHAAAVRALTDKSLETKWVYVGYSMRDADLAVLLQQPQFGRYMDEHWVAPLPDAHVESFVAAHRVPVWRKWNKKDTFLEHSLTETADNFLTQFADALGVAVALPQDGVRVWDPDPAGSDRLR